MAKGNGKSGKPVEQQILDEMRAGFERLHQDNLDMGLRIDRLIETLSEYWRDHEARLRLVEEKLGLR